MVVRADSIVAGENSENAVADQFQNISAVTMNRRDDCVGVIIEKRNDLAGGGAIGDPRVAAQIAEPKRRFDLVGDAAVDLALQHALAGIASEVSFH